MEKWIYRIKKVSLLLAACAFFGLFYPEFCLNEDTCRVVCEDGQTEEGTEYGSELYYRLLSAKPEEIKAKSRLWELLKNWF